MSIELNDEQQAALQSATEEPVQVINPRTQETFRLVPEVQYARLREIFAVGPFTTEERQAILRGVWNRADWDDPQMDQYQSLVLRKPT